MTCSTGLKITKATTNAMYASLDLHKRMVHAVLKDSNGSMVKESKREKEMRAIQKLAKLPRKRGFIDVRQQ